MKSTVYIEERYGRPYAIIYYEDKVYAGEPNGWCEVNEDRSSYITRTPHVNQLNQLYYEQLASLLYRQHEGE